MDAKKAHDLYFDLNNDGRGFALTGHENALVTDEIAEAGLTIVADHGDGLLECVDHFTNLRYLVGGDGSRRNAWAVRIRIHFDYEDTICDTCNGTMQVLEWKKYPRVCGHCNGTGRVTYRHIKYSGLEVA